MNKSLKFFDAYIAAGFKPIALYKNSKIPVERQWNSNWSCERWRDYFVNGDYNMGFLLGEVVDIEGDTKEANETLCKLIGQIRHPCFQSHKSTHHLFLNPDKDLTRISKHGIEFRGYNHQSVVPPSKHGLGGEYRWLVGSCKDIPEMPQSLLQFYLDYKEKYQTNKRSDNLKGKKRSGLKKTTCNLCKKEFFVHFKRLQLEVKAFREINLLWMCRGCRRHDVRQSCRLIRQKISQAS